MLAYPGNDPSVWRDEVLSALFIVVDLCQLNRANWKTENLIANSTTEIFSTVAFYSQMLGIVVSVDGGDFEILIQLSVNGLSGRGDYIMVAVTLLRGLCRRWCRNHVCRRFENRRPGAGGEDAEVVFNVRPAGWSHSTEYTAAEDNGNAYDYRRRGSAGHRRRYVVWLTTLRLLMKLLYWRRPLNT